MPGGGGDGGGGDGGGLGGGDGGGGLGGGDGSLSGASRCVCTTLAPHGATVLPSGVGTRPLLK